MKTESGGTPFLGGPDPTETAETAAALRRRELGGSSSASSNNSSSENSFLEMSSKQKTWKELRNEVQSVRKKIWSLGYRLPHTFTFRDLENSRRIYFMSSPPHCRENAIYAIEVPDDAEPFREGRDSRVKYSWIDVLDIGNKGRIPPTKEEQLMMERKRITPSGISSYEFHDESSTFVFSASSSLFFCKDLVDLKDSELREEAMSRYMKNMPPPSQRTEEHHNQISLFYSSLKEKEYPLQPKEIRMSKTSGARMNPEVCPFNSDLVAFVNYGDIWVVNSKTGQEERLTFTKSCDDVDSPISAGLPSYIMQEEFNRFHGFWWRPQCDLDGIHYILYEEVDESNVNRVSLLTMPGKDPEKFRFPVPGSPNAKSELKIAQFEIIDDRITNIKSSPMVYPLYSSFSWAEYIVRIGWCMGGEYYWLQLLDRAQKRLELVLFPFLEPFRGMRSEIIPYSAPAYVLYAENSSTWVNVNDLLLFTNSSLVNISFIWASEESKFRHLYLIRSELRPALLKNWDCSNVSPICLSPRILQKKALTKGDWEVINNYMGINFELGFLFFLGTRETPLERHVYVVSINNPDEIKLLTEPGCSYCPTFNEDCSLVVLNWSSIKHPPTSQLFRIVYGGTRADDVELELLTYILEPSPFDPKFPYPEIESYQLENGMNLYAMVYKPFNFNPMKKYPTILNIYGGPEVQLVVNTFRGSPQLWLYLLASQGYCVVAIDSRGSHHRGVEFESYIHRRMGTVELKDQVEVLQYLAKKKGFIDMNRVGINGWSYGGYLSLMGLIQYPDIFKVCVAGAPVTSWELYDTGYTERYMDLPDENAEGYRESSVLSHMNLFPDEEGRLLLVHGLNDENVHFLHSAELINCLIRAGKPYQLLVYPNERHSLRRLEASEHYETGLLSFLQKRLRPFDNVGQDG